MYKISSPYRSEFPVSKKTDLRLGFQDRVNASRVVMLFAK